MSKGGCWLLVCCAPVWLGFYGFSAILGGPSEVGPPHKISMTQPGLRIEEGIMKNYEVISLL